MAAGLVAAPAATADTHDDGPVEAGITVPRMDGMPEDFINGVDISSVLSLEESGVVFRDWDGEEADLFEVLAEADVNYVRIRVWNDPFDEEGRGYGGGNVDVERAVEIGRRATEAGMQVKVNFHYSDFWADPGKQMTPKAWEGMTVEQKAVALHDFTAEALQEFVDAGVDVGMVQVGNETNSRMAGVAGWDGMATLFDAGAAAVREVTPDALVALHFTNPETAGRYATIARELDERDVDYDVFASSYYAFWHGSLTNLTTLLTDIAETYDKQVMVAETSWSWTLEDGDGHENTVRTEYPQYPASVQGQATAVRDVIEAVVEMGDAGLGVFYWEPAWLPVGPPDQVDQNRLLWEEFGSGWATSYAGEYDPVDAGRWYGGTSWDNQALFDFQGHPLESLNVFRYARTGAVAPRGEGTVEPVRVTVADGDPVVLPGTVTVSYADGTSEEESVTWSGAEQWIRGPGGYRVTGTTGTGLAVTATVVVQAVNHLVNPSFEDWDAGWTLTAPANVQDSPGNAWDSQRAVNVWSATPYTFTVEQTVTGLPEGTYTVSARGHGESPSGQVLLVAETADGEASAPFRLAGWTNWSQPTVDDVVVGEDGTVTVRIAGDLPGDAWAWFDDVVLTQSVATDVDTTDLAAQLALAQAVDREAWTADSLAGLDRAVEVAEVVLGGSRATQDDVDAAAALVAAALAALEPAPVDPGPVDPGPVDPGPVDPGPVDPGPVDPGEPGEPGEPRSFSDVPVTHPFYEQITWASAYGIAQGYDDGTFRPSVRVSRQAMAAFVYRLHEGGDPAPACTTAPFTDVPVSHPFCGEIAWMKDTGLSTGYADGTYQPSRGVSRQAMAAFLFRMLNEEDTQAPACRTQPFNDVATNHPFCGEIRWLAEREIVRGYDSGDYQPERRVSRQAMTAFLYNVWEATTE